MIFVFTPLLVALWSSQARKTREPRTYDQNGLWLLAVQTLRLPDPRLRRLDTGGVPSAAGCG